MQEVFTAGRYFRKNFGENVYKVPVSILGFTCPNIDGTVAYGGCVFCENESFSPNLGIQKVSKKFTLNPHSIHNPFLDSQLAQLSGQFKKTKIKLQKKFDAKKFLVYFQSFTNTYAPFDTLKVLYDKALGFEDVIGLSIGTRTDSIEERVLEYLANKAKTKEIWVEYGIQSVSDKTLQRINRGHSVQNVIDGIKLTKSYGLKVCAHLIFGLPGESQEMMLRSVQMAIDLGVESVKLHPLYVVKRTALANDYISGKFTPISEELYLDTLTKAIQMFPQNVMIQRVSAGISDDTLLAPIWCGNKHSQIYKIKQALLKKGLVY